MSVKDLRIPGAVLVFSLLLGACGEGSNNVASTPAVERGPREPAGEALAQLYNRSCRSCHAMGTAAAPLTGDFAAWAPRLEQGMDVLLDHTINGYQGMPPMGMCFDCSEEDFRALISFMARGEG